MQWKEELNGFRFSMPRCIFPTAARDKHLHVFADASSVAIGYVIYASCDINTEERHVSFVTAGSKVAPKAATTIPRLELCAAVEASIATHNIMRELNVSIQKVECFTDSKIVLGYLTNRKK